MRKGSNIESIISDYRREQVYNKHPKPRQECKFKPCSRCKYKEVCEDKVKQNT